jgi:hypothetical protein
MKLKYIDDKITSEPERSKLRIRQIRAVGVIWDRDEKVSLDDQAWFTILTRAVAEGSSNLNSRRLRRITLFILVQGARASQLLTQSKKLKMST